MGMFSKPKLKGLASFDSGTKRYLGSVCNVMALYVMMCGDSRYGGSGGSGGSWLLVRIGLAKHS